MFRSPPQTLSYQCRAQAKLGWNLRSVAQGRPFGGDVGQIPPMLIKCTVRLDSARIRPKLGDEFDRSPMRMLAKSGRPSCGHREGADSFEERRVT